MNYTYSRICQPLKILGMNLELIYVFLVLGNGIFMRRVFTKLEYIDYRVHFLNFIL